MRFRLPSPPFLALALVATLAFATRAPANEGLLLLSPDPVQLGLGSSGIAAPRTSYWTFFNPASIVELEPRADVGLELIFTDAELRPRGIIGNRLNGKLESRGDFRVPFVGAVFDPPGGGPEAGEAGWRWGASVVVPSGAGVDFPYSRNLLSRIFQRNADRKLFHQNIRLVLGAGYRFSNGWAVGFNIQPSLTRLKSDHLTLRLRPTDGNFEWDEAVGAGFAIGVYKSWNEGKWAFGAVYQSQHWVDSLDEYSDLLFHPVDLPPTYTAGLAYKPHPKWTVMADFRFVHWETVNLFSKPVLQGGFQWQNQKGVKLGVEYESDPQWTFRAGLTALNSPIDEDHVFATGLVPATVEYGIAGGVTYSPKGKPFEFHLTVLRDLPHRQKDTGRGGIFSNLGFNTEIDSSGWAVGIGASWLFGRN